MRKTAGIDTYWFLGLLGKDLADPKVLRLLAITYRARAVRNEIGGRGPHTLRSREVQVSLQ
jgi:hypothetical protein